MNKILLYFIAFISLFLISFQRSALAYSKYFLGNLGLYSTSESELTLLKGDDDGGDNDGDDDKDEDDDKDDDSGDDKDEDEDKDDDKDDDKDKDDDDDDKPSNSNSSNKKFEVRVKTQERDAEDDDEDEDEDSDDDGIEDEVEDELESEIEIEEAGIKFKSHTKVEKDGRREVEIKRETEVGKIELKVKDGKVELKVKSKDPAAVQALYEDLLEASESAELLSILPKDGDGVKGKVKIKYHDGELEVESKVHSAGTKFPLSVDPETNTLIVETPSGNINLSILPDQAVNNLVLREKVDTVVASEIVENESGDETDDKLVYEIEGLKNVKFVGLIPVSAKVTATVGAQSGAIIADDKPWYLDIFGFLFSQS